MKNLIRNIKVMLLIAAFGLFGFVLTADAADKPKADNSSKPVNEKPQEQIKYTSITSPLLLVNNPYMYLNKNVEFTAKFNKFSSLGLDYPPAKRESQVYTGVLIERDDVKNHVIPLSELKMFLKIEELKKITEISSGDKVRIKGKVFSAALGDPWLDINELTILEHVNKDSADKQ